MPGKTKWLASATLAASLWASCGGGGGGDDPLAKYSGQFSLVEMFERQEGTLCPAPPDPSENRVTIKIVKNSFAATFEQRWGKMGGEIGADLKFIAVNKDAIPGLSLQLTGSFSGLDAFSASIRELMQGCTRIRSLSGTREGG